jgi:MFS family permease
MTDVAPARQQPGNLAAAVGVTLGAQALVVLASLVLPVAGAVVLPALGASAHLVGWYAAAVFLAGAVSTLITPRAVARFGPVRVHQVMLLLGALGLAILPLGIVALLPGAVLIGLAYGPANPASSALLARLTPAALHNRVFSLKQVAVPLGAAAAGLGVPPLLAVLGWGWLTLSLAGAMALAAALLAFWRGRLDAPWRGAPAAASAGLLDPLRAIGPRSASFRLASAALLLAAVQFSFSTFLPTVLVQSAGWSVGAAGAVLTVALAVSIVARLVLGWAADRFMARRVLIALAMLMAASAATSAMVGPATPGSVVVLVAGLFGFAAFGWNGLMLAEVARLADHRGVAAATAGTMTLIYAGAAIGPALFGLALALSGGVAAGCLLLAIVAVGALLGLLIQR